MLTGAVAAIATALIAAGLPVARMLRQRNAAVRSLAVTRDRLAEAERLGKIGHWVTDLRTGHVVLSDECFEILGLPRAPHLPIEAAVRAIHPDDRPRYLAVREAPEGELETEGLGIMAIDMGYQCWGMPNLEVLHAPE